MLAAAVAATTDVAAGSASDAAGVVLAVADVASVDAVAALIVDTVYPHLAVHDFVVVAGVYVGGATVAAVALTGLVVADVALAGVAVAAIAAGVASALVAAYCCYCARC